MRKIGRDPCKVDGCELPSDSRGLCRNHYARWRRHGSTDRVAPLYPKDDTPIQRWARFVVLPENKNHCWQWTGAKTGARPGEQAYGQFALNGKPVRLAHRYSYERFVGEIPEGYQIDHICRNRLCVNPDHLEAVTPHTNMRRGINPAARNARKTHCIRGHPFSPENTRIKADGRSRVCLTCAEIRYRQSREPNNRGVGNA